MIKIVMKANPSRVGDLKDSGRQRAVVVDCIPELRDGRDLWS